MWLRRLRDLGNTCGSRGGGESRAEIPTWPLANCVILYELLNLSELIMWSCTNYSRPPLSWASSFLA